MGRIVRRVLAAGLAAALLLALAGGCVLLQLRPPAPPAPPERGALLAGVTVVRPGAGRVAARTVRVEGGRIASIRPSRPGDAEAADAEGGFLLPGLVDMHVHAADAAIAGQVELFSLLYLAHGVTSVRNTGGGTEQLERRERVARGELPGPRVFACGPLHDGAPPIWPSSVVVERPERAAGLVEEHAAAGFDCLKVYERLEPEALAALVRAAREHGLPVVGHVPDRVRFEDAGIGDVQHLRGLFREAPREPILPPAERVRRRWRDAAELGEERVEAVLRTSLAQGVAHTPTLALLHRGARLDRWEAQRDEPAMALLPRFYAELAWSPRGTRWFAALGPGDWETGRRAARQAKRLVLALFRGGARIHAGTDVGNPFLVPGASLHEELRHLVDAGLTAEEAFATATRWPGEELGEPGLGRLAEGAPADLLLLREDPTRDLDALASLEAVVADGRLYPRARLERALREARRHYRGWLYDRVSMAIGRHRRAEALARAEERRAARRSEAGSGW